MAKHSSPETRITNSSGNNTGDAIALPVGLELGHYRLLRKVGKGGFGITYLAEHKLSHELVVIKENMPTSYAYRDKDSLHVYPLDDGSSAENYAHTLQRFVEEARTLARLNHPNIVRVYEAFEAFGTAYYVMPLVTGKELHKAAPATVDEDWLLPILKSILQALNYLHGENLLHRDIKPNNIILREDGTPILIDFGTARALQSEHSSTMVSTPGYTPIEQITPHGKRGPWTDMYALGATCYRLITGECPPQSIERIEDDPYRPLATRSGLKRRFSARLLRSIDKALAVHAKNRWQSAKEWLDELKRCASQRSTCPLSIPLTAVTAITSATPKPHTKKPAASGVLTQIFIGLFVELLVALGYGAYTHMHALAQTPASPVQHPTPEQPADNNSSPAPITAADEEERLDLEQAEREAREQAEREAREKAEREAREKAEREAREKAEREAREKAERDPREKAEREAREKAKKDAQDKLAAMGIKDYDEAILQHYNNPEKLKLLITVGADVNKADKLGHTPLYQATDEGHTACVKLLLAAPGIEVNKADNNDWPPLNRAAYKGHTECVKLLLAAPGIDVNKADKLGHTPLYQATAEGHTECVKLLLAAPGIEVNKADNKGWTPLFWAAYIGRTGVVKLLLAAPSIEVNKADKYGRTPLYWAANGGHTECVKLLLAAPGIDVNKADKDGDTPLYRAAEEDHMECVKLLLAAPGIDVNKADEYGNTPLRWAALAGHAECVKLLLAAPGIEVNKADNGGWTPLFLAACHGRTEVVKLLLAAPGIEVNKADKDGRTPLRWAATRGHTEIVKLLKAAGAKK